MIAAPCFLHAHALGQTFFIEQKAGIVAAHVDKSAKRIAKAQDEKRHRIHAKADFGVALLCAEVSILGNAHALGDGKDCEPTFRRAVARSLPNLVSDRLTAGGRTSDTFDLIYKAPYIKPYGLIWSNI
jgi:hypothetical protein